VPVRGIDAPLKSRHLCVQRDRLSYLRAEMLYRETAVRVRTLEHTRPSVLSAMARAPAGMAVMRALLDVMLAHVTRAEHVRARVM
jgi:hypothetical protein